MTNHVPCRSGSPQAVFGAGPGFGNAAGLVVVAVWPAMEATASETRMITPAAEAIDARYRCRIETFLSCRGDLSTSPRYQHRGVGLHKARRCRKIQGTV